MSTSSLIFKTNSKPFWSLLLKKKKNNLKMEYLKCPLGKFERETLFLQICLCGMSQSIHASFFFMSGAAGNAGFESDLHPLGI